MQQFVIEISNYAKNINKNFLIIPQNGVELAFNEANPEENINYSYLQAIDGLGVEELHYNGKYQPNNETIEMLRKIKAHKKILVSEYIEDDNSLANAMSLNQNEGYIPFIRTKNNYYYNYIPNYTINFNNNDISSLNTVENFLYLINDENFQSKQQLIDEISKTDYDLIILDLFFENETFSKEDLKKLKTKHNGHKRLVIAYINIGAAENYRYYWKKDWKLHNPKWIKKKYKGYEDEYWVEFWNEEWKNIIFGNDNSYIKKILDVGFDGAYLDNVEAYYFLYKN